MILKMNFMKKDQIMTEIEVDYKTRTVKIENKTSVLLDRAFGIIENPTFEDYEEMLEDRCLPRTRDRLPLALKSLGVPYYDPLLIVRKTKGYIAGDSYWIDIVEEIL